jgi:hypothetical protein
LFDDKTPSGTFRATTTSIVTTYASALTEPATNYFTPGPMIPEFGMCDDELCINSGRTDKLQCG